MTILVTGAKAMGTLPPLIRAEQQRMDSMERNYNEYTGHAGVTQRDLARQRGVILGLRMAMTHVLQEDWCSKNEHPVPMATLDDADRVWQA